MDTRSVSFLRWRCEAARAAAQQCINDQIKCTKGAAKPIASSYPAERRTQIQSRAAVPLDAVLAPRRLHGGAFGSSPPALADWASTARGQCARIRETGRGLSSCERHHLGNMSRCTSKGGGTYSSGGIGGPRRTAHALGLRKPLHR
jgi:hypothetical protein